MYLGCCQVLEEEAREYMRRYGAIPRSPDVRQILECLYKLGYRQADDIRDGDIIVSGNHFGRAVGLNMLNYQRGIRVLTPLERIRVDMILRRS